MIKTHTFKGKKYNIEFVGRIDGVTDTAFNPDDPLYMTILDGDDLRAFHSAVHESMEAAGFCDDCLHDEDGDFATWDIARFLWRWIDRLNTTK